MESGMLTRETLASLMEWQKEKTTWIGGLGFISDSLSWLLNRSIPPRWAVWASGEFLSLSAMPSIYRGAGCWSSSSVRLSDDLSVFVPSSSDKHPQDEESNDEESEASGSNLVPVNDPSVLLWFALELAGLNNPLHHLMAKEILIVELLVLCGSSQVGEVVLFLFVHCSVPCQLFICWRLLLYAHKNKIFTESSKISSFSLTKMIIEPKVSIG